MMFTAPAGDVMTTSTCFRFLKATGVDYNYVSVADIVVVGSVAAAG